MKVIFITREGYNLSGARVRCYNFSRTLRQYGVNTEVFSLADNLGAKYAEKEAEMVCLDKLIYNVKAFKILLEEEKDSIFYIQRLNYHILAPYIASLLKKNRLIFDCDDWNIREDPKYYFGFFPSSKMEFLTRILAKYANVCIAASVFLQDYLRKFNNKVYYIPTGVDTVAFKPKKSDNNPYKITFSWIGTVYHEEMCENIKFILSCFSVLAGKYNNIFLHIAGDGKYLKEINVYAGSLKCKERVKIDGWIPPDEIPNYLSNVDIGLLPLTQDTKFNKAKSPTKLFEYMAMEKPTVSSNIGEAAEVIQDGRNGFLAQNKEKFIEMMQELVNGVNLRQEMGKEARKTVESRYSLDVLSKRLYEILKTV